MDTQQDDRIAYGRIGIEIKCARERERIESLGMGCAGAVGSELAQGGAVRSAHWPQKHEPKSRDGGVKLQAGRIKVGSV